MKNSRIFIITAGLFLVILTAFAISSAFAWPNPNVYQSYSPIPTPRPCPSPGSYKEMTTEGGEGDVSSIGGMDSANGLTAVGDVSSPASIRIHDGESWSSMIVDFNPSGVEWSGETTSSIYISDNLNNSIFFSSDPMAGSEWVMIGSPGSEKGQFRNPNGMYSGQINELYVVDTDNNRVQFWNGVEWHQADSPAEALYMVDICKFGETFFITDYLGHCIYRKGPADTEWFRITDQTHLNYPSYMDVDSDGNLYVLSRISYPDGLVKSIVRYSEGQFSVCVGAGSGPGFITGNLTSEELCVNHHNNLIYPDPVPAKIYQKLCDVNKIHTFVINGISVEVPPSVHEVFHGVGPETATVSIEALKACPFSSVSGEGVFPLPSGTSQYPFVCTSESGIPAQYFLTITKESGPEPSPSPEISPSPSPSPEPSVTPSPTPSPSPALSPSPSPTPSPSAPPSQTPSSSPTASPQPSPSASASAPPSETPSETPQPEQSATASPQPDASETASPLPESDEGPGPGDENGANDILKALGLVLGGGALGIAGYAVVNRVVKKKKYKK
ncbi:MAG: hypothetical protein JXB33_00500 [Clostridia bacterium]|nr:hypothetical protein [Clostridia bacterium]